MRSWTREAKASFAFSSIVFPAAATSEYRLEGGAPRGTPHPGHLAEAGVLADGHRVGGPRGLERQSWSHLDDGVPGELGGVGEEVGLEGFAQEPLERVHLVGGECGGDLDVEALLGDDGGDRAVHRGLGVGLAAQRGARLVAEERPAEELHDAPS
jgi:hypothetical protein